MTDIEDISSRIDQVRPVVSYLEVPLPYKPLTPNKIGEALKGPQIQFWKEASFLQCDNNKNVSLLSNTMPIKSLPDGKKFIFSLIDPIIR